MTIIWLALYLIKQENNILALVVISLASLFTDYKILSIII